MTFSEIHFECLFWQVLVEIKLSENEKDNQIMWLL